MTNSHTFHIPVMGIGFTIDTPLKVAHYGISSVMAIGDDHLLEKLRKMYCGTYKLPYEAISEKIDDFRAKRITSYLNMIQTIAEGKFEEYKQAAIDKGSELSKYFSMLPDTSTIKQEFQALAEKHLSVSEIRTWVKNNLSMGSIDVNIMTKLDRANFVKGVPLPVEYNDAHAAVRGYANSTLSSSIVLSAGMNPRLYGYLEQFEDFFPGEDGSIKKKVVLKVSDYRSALIQGKFLAKKGIWVSEYRIESGLNCGGHAFATEGFLLGPILAEFRDKRTELIEATSEILIKALEEKNRPVPKKVLPLRVTAQGGVGTAEEHQFLMTEYSVDSVGWGTPFLLVPEATNVDEPTLKKLSNAREEDLYLSDVSPLGVAFNNLKGNSKDLEKYTLVEQGRPGSPCVKKHLVFNTEFTEQPICTASRQYQNLKIKELDEAALPLEEYQKAFEKIIDKTCLCRGLGTSVLLVNGLQHTLEGDGVAICPGPNMAYFSKVISLAEATDHIYGRTSVIIRKDRPHMFIKELDIYLKYLHDKVEDAGAEVTPKLAKYFAKFATNLQAGISYYFELFAHLEPFPKADRDHIFIALGAAVQLLNRVELKIKQLSKPVVCTVEQVP